MQQLQWLVCGLAGRLHSAVYVSAVLMPTHPESFTAAILEPRHLGCTPTYAIVCALAEPWGTPPQKLVVWWLNYICVTNLGCTYEFV
jgi:hypothetical protein